jgi:Domain of unknown function (DUF4190)/zinc-ribbon domain
MFCTRCGTSNLDGDQFCRSCSSPLTKPGGAQRPAMPSGAPQQQYPYSTPGPAQQQYPYSTPGPAQQQQPPPGYPPYPGYQVHSQPEYGYASQSHSPQAGASGRAIASMVMSIVSLFTCGALLSIPGMILGKMEMNAIQRGQAPRSGETMAKVGFYVGLGVTILTCLVVVLYAILVLGTASNSFQ